MSEKPKLAFYWAASCGGCEISLVNTHEKILDVDAHFDLFFCPCLLDRKKKDVEALADGSLAITFFNGAIRTAENEEMAHLMRRKSQVLIAYGACAVSGGIPALSNLHSREDHFRHLYLENPTIDNPTGTLPQTEVSVAEGPLHLPAFFDTVKTLAQTVEVDYFFPGCPPESNRLAEVIDLVIAGGPLPPKGSFLGAGRKSVCDECKRKKDEKKGKRFFRHHEIVPDREKCLLEQGIVCLGVATRDGCGARCPEANMPCIGCYGPPEGVLDQGGKLVSTLGGMLDIEDLKGLPEEALAAKIDERLAGVTDPAGTAYKFSLSASSLRRAVREQKGKTRP